MPINTYYGADVSTYQGVIDWDQAAPTKDFFWYKGGGGDGVDQPHYIDNEAANNLAQLQAHGKPHGCYWFAGNTDPIDEANYACANIWGNMNTGAWAILDVERGTNGLPSTDWVKLFLDTASATLGYRPVVYMNQNTENSYDWSVVVNANYGLIIADYAVPPSGNVGLKHWPFYVAQQYSSLGAIAGIAGNVDLDAAFLTDFSDYHKYGRPEPVVSPVLPTPPAPTPTPVDSTTITQPVENPDESVVVPVTVIPAVPTPPPVPPTPPVVIPPVVSHTTNPLSEVKQTVQSIIERIVITFVEAVVAYSAVAPTHTLDKTAIAGAIGAGASAVYNLLKQYFAS